MRILHSCLNIDISNAAYSQEISVRREILSTIPPHVLHILKETAEYISKRVSQQAGETCFLNNEMLKMFHACPSINKSTERRPREPRYSPPLFPTIANHCSLILQPALLPEPASTARDAQKPSAQYVFSALKEVGCSATLFPGSSPSLSRTRERTLETRLTLRGQVILASALCYKYGVKRRELA